MPYILPLTYLFYEKFQNNLKKYSLRAFHYRLACLAYGHCFVSYVGSLSPFSEALSAEYPSGARVSITSSKLMFNINNEYVLFTGPAQGIMSPPPPFLFEDRT